MKSYMIILFVSLILLIHFENIDAAPRKRWLSKASSKPSAASSSSTRSTPATTPRDRSLARASSMAERNLINRRSDYQCWYNHYLPFFKFLENTSYFPGLHGFLTDYGFFPSNNFVEFYEQNPPSDMDSRTSDQMCRQIQSSILRTYSDLVGSTFVEPESTAAQQFAAKILELCDKVRTDANCSESYRSKMVLRNSLEFAYSRIKGSRALDEEFRRRCPEEDAQSEGENQRNR